MIDAYFITFPRSGKNWLSWYLDLNTDLDIDFGHYVKINKNTPAEFFKSRMYEIQSAAGKDYSKVFSHSKRPSRIPCVYKCNGKFFSNRF